MPDEVALTPSQQKALHSLQDWWNRADPEIDGEDVPQEFLLDGAAGTGKTFLLRRLLDVVGVGAVLFTAPTNKAVKVMRSTLLASFGRAECCTIFSALGLQMKPDGEIKVLQAREKNHKATSWPRIGLLVIDEASMVGTNLLPHLDRIMSMYPHLRILYVGDSAQLPPVNESISPVFHRIPENCRCSLTEVVRQENQILSLASAIRHQLDTSWFPQVTLQDDNDGEEGVWKLLGQAEADSAILSAVESGRFLQPNGAKCIAWRNVIVNKLNFFVRSHLFPETTQLFCEGDRIILTEPANIINEEGSLGHSDHYTPPWPTDSEGSVTHAELLSHPYYPEFDCWHLLVRGDDGENMSLWTLSDSPKMQAKWKARKNELAAIAKQTPREWGKFWQFLEAFHSVRHGYAITAHRAQGSTYQEAFVFAGDIFCNRDRMEAFRCMYVACTRPKYKLYLW